MSYLCFVQRVFDRGEGSGFGWAGKWRDWSKIAPKYFEKALIFQTNIGTL